MPNGGLNEQLYEAGIHDQFWAAASRGDTETIKELLSTIGIYCDDEGANRYVQHARKYRNLVQRKDRDWFKEFVFYACLAFVTLMICCAAFFWWMSR